MVGLAKTTSLSARDASTSKTAKKTTKTTTYKQDSSGNISTEVHTEVDRSSDHNQQSIRRLEERVQILVDDLDSEQHLRKRIEREKQDLQLQLINVSERLAEVETGSENQSEVARRREAEITKLRKLLDDVHTQSEQAVYELKKRHQQILMELQEQVNESNRSKEKILKEKSRMQVEVQELIVKIEMLQSEKVSIRKVVEKLEINIHEQNIKIEHMSKCAADMELKNNMLANQNCDSGRQSSQLKQELDTVIVERNKLVVKVKEYESNLTCIIKEKAQCESTIKSLEHDLKSLSFVCEDVKEANKRLDKQVVAVREENQAWKRKYEDEARQHIEDVESLKRSFNAQINGLQSDLDALRTKLKMSEGQKGKLQEEMSCLIAELEATKASLSTASQRLVVVEKECRTTHEKLREVTLAWERADHEVKSRSQEILKLANELDRARMDLESARKDNGKLVDENKMHVKELEVMRTTLHQIEVELRKTAHDRETIVKELRDTMAAREKAEVKLRELEHTLSVRTTEWERSLTAKDEELYTVKKKSAVEIDTAMGRAEEAEARLRNEVEKIKKKMTITINEMQTALSSVNLKYTGLQNVHKDQQAKIHNLNAVNEELSAKLNESLHLSQSITDKMTAAETRSQKLNAALEQAVNERNAADRAVKDVSSRLSIVSSSVSELESCKISMTKELNSLSTAYSDVTKELKCADERANKYGADVQHFESLLRESQMRISKLEQAKKAAENQVRIMTVRVEEMETNTSMTTNVTIKKMETRIVELEELISKEKCLHLEAVSALHKRDRLINEFTMQSDEDRKNILVLQESVEKLNEKIKMYKRQLEEQEMISNSNIMRVKKFQRELESAESRALDAESSLDSMRSRQRILSHATTLASKQSEASEEVVERSVVVNKSTTNLTLSGEGVNKDGLRSAARCGSVAPGSRFLRSGSVAHQGGYGATNSSSSMAQQTARSGYARTYDSQSRATSMSRAGSVLYH